MTLDPIIAQMKATECKDCRCLSATSDIDEQDVKIGQQVEILGTFCYPIPGHTHIEIMATDLENGNIVWSKVCDTGQMCSIPFSSDIGLVCDPMLDES